MELSLNVNLEIASMSKDKFPSIPKYLRLMFHNYGAYS